MKVRITTEIITALYQYKTSYPQKTNKEIGEKLGVSESHVGRLLADKYPSIKPATWERMKPLIEKFISADVVALAEAGIPYLASGKPAIPAELLPDIEAAANDLHIPVASINAGLLAAFVEAYKTNTMESLWPPRLEGFPWEGC